MAQIWPLNPVRRREWPVCGARVCGEQDSGRSTLRFTILPRAALFEKAICGTTTCGRQQRCTQRIGTRDPRPAEASRSLAMRGLFHTPAARDSDMHVASMPFQCSPGGGDLCTSLRKKGCCGLAVVVRAVHRIALAESHTASGGIFAALRTATARWLSR